MATDDKAFQVYVSTLGKNLLREAFSSEDSFSNVEEVARNTQACNIKEIIENLVEKKLLSVELFRDPQSDGNREIMGIIPQKRAKKVLESLKILTEQDIDTILSTCRVRGTVEDLFNYLDFIMLARTFKVDNLEQDRLEIENLKETIKSSKETLEKQRELPSRGGKASQFFLKVKNALYYLSGKKEQIFKKVHKNKEGRVSYLELQKTLKNATGLQYSIDELSEFLFRFMPRNQSGMDQYDFLKFLKQLQELTVGGQSLKEHRPLGSASASHELKVIKAANINDFLYEIAAAIFREQVELCNYFHKHDIKGNGFLSREIFVTNLPQKFPFVEEQTLRQLFDRYGHESGEYIDVVNLMRTCLLTIIEEIFYGKADEDIEEDIEGRPKLRNIECSPVRQDALRRFIAAFFLDAMDILRCLRKRESNDEKLKPDVVKEVLKDYKIEITNTQITMVQQYFDNNLVSFKLFETLEYCVWGFSIF